MDGREKEREERQEESKGLLMMTGCEKNKETRMYGINKQKINIHVKTHTYTHVDAYTGTHTR